MTPTFALWRPGWYGLGQTIVAGGTGVFIMTYAIAPPRPDIDQVRLQFWDNLVGDESSAFAVQATIRFGMRHPVKFAGSSFIPRYQALQIVH
jgi:hypothetical protein